MNLNYKQLNKTYLNLLVEAEQSTSRKDAVYFIRQADKIRMEMCKMEIDYPVVYSQ